MEFCPRCGSLLVQKRKNFGCSRCSYTSTGKVILKTSEKMENTNKGVIVARETKSVHPIVNERCKKCGHEKAFFWTVQTRASDEAETKFFKCEKCDNTWREYR